MWWRIKRSEYNQMKGKGNKRAFKKIVKSGEIPGILAYFSGEPIGWCSVAPREVFPGLEKSRSLKRFDEKPVWSITCLFILRSMRRKGVSRELIKAVLNYARNKGVKIVEGYPHEPKKGKLPDVFAWTGFASSYLNNGFVEVFRRSETRPIVRTFL